MSDLNDAKEEIRSKLAIEDVIGQYVQLKRAGRYWKGLSPFTNERTPSFIVTPERDIWHDFSSGQGGDIFSFIMLAEGVDFMGAMEILAKKAGVDLSQYDRRRPQGQGQKKERILDMNILAVNYFQHCLIDSKPAMSYARDKRQLTKQTILDWGIGYAPSRHNLKQLLMDKGYSREEIKSAGLNLFEDYNFRGEGEGYHGGNRLMIPLRDSQGQVVGFTARILDNHQPKYINTPATLVYDKGRQLFGLSFAKKAIREQDFVIVVEGNMDVMTSSQVGVKNIVAVAGTALTEYHLKSLGRLTNDIRFCFDSDRAGVAATERAIKLAEPLDLKLSVIDYSSAGVKDPDELIKKDVEAWKKLASTNVPAVDWVINKYVATNDLTTAEGKKEVTTKALNVVRGLSDPVEVEFYLKKIADVTGVSLDSVKAKLKGEATKAAARPVHLKPAKTKLDELGKRNSQYCLNAIFAIASQDQTCRGLLVHLPDDALNDVFQRLKYLLLNQPLKGQPVKLTSDLSDKLAELTMFYDQELAAAKNNRLMILENFTQLERLKTATRLDQLQAQFNEAFEQGNDGVASDINREMNVVRGQLNNIERSNASNDFAGLRTIWQIKD